MKKTLFMLMLVFALVLATTPAFATPTLTLSDGTNSVTVADGGLGDLNPLVGEITFLGTIGSWYSNVTTGISDPSKNLMDLNSVDATSTDGGMLSIILSDTGFRPSGSLLVGVGGTTQGTVTINSYVTDSQLTGLPFPTSSMLTTGPLSGGTGDKFSASNGVNITIPTGNYLDLVAIIEHNGAARTSFDASAKVPEPGTMLLLGSGLLGLMFHRRSRK